MDWKGQDWYPYSPPFGTFPHTRLWESPSWQIAQAQSTGQANWAWKLSLLPPQCHSCASNCMEGCSRSCTNNALRGFGLEQWRRNYATEYSDHRDHTPNAFSGIWEIYQQLCDIHGVLTFLLTDKGLGFWFCYLREATSWHHIQISLCDISLVRFNGTWNRNLSIGSFYALESNWSFCYFFDIKSVLVLQYLTQAPLNLWLKHHSILSC